MPERAGPRLDGRTALVTGAGRNLGRAMALALAAAGADVVLGALSDATAAEGVAGEIRALGRRAIVATGDLGTREGIDALERAASAFDRIDILVNNAAIRPRQAFLELEASDWDRVLRANLRGPIACCRRFLPGMLQGGFGRIVNVSGIDAFEPMTHRAHNITAKTALLGLTRALAAEFGARGVTVNAVVPGVFDTSRSPGDYPSWPLPDELVRAMVPAGRLGQPAELASLCVFLASDAAAYINGQAIHCNGGKWMT